MNQLNVYYIIDNPEIWIVVGGFVGSYYYEYITLPNVVE